MTSLFVRGRPGVGKTTLVHRFLDYLTESASAVVLSCRCREQERVPYKAIDGIIDALSRHLKGLEVSEARELMPRDVQALVRVFPVLSRVDAVAGAPSRAAEVSDPRELRRRAFIALRDLLARIGDRCPLVLFIDDLQWGDVDSAALLAEVLRFPDAPVLLLLGTYRSEEGSTSPFLQGLREPQGALSAIDHSELDVDPLSLTEAEELAFELLGQDTPGGEEHARTIARESLGSPFFVHELVRDARRADRPRAAAGVLDELLWSRIERLPEPSRRLLEVVAVSGRPLGHGDATAAAGLDSGQQAALAALRSGRLVRSAGPPEDGQIEVSS